MIKKKSLLVLSLSLISLLSFAQDIAKETDKFRSLALSYNLEYTPQKNYEYLSRDPGVKFYPRKRQFANYNFGLYNKKSDVIILMGFYLLGQGALYGSDQYVDSMANLLPMQKFVSNFGDTAGKEIPLRISDKLLNEINATAVNIFKVKVDFPYKQYGYIRSVNFQRKDLGGVQMYFLVTDESKSDVVDREILNTWGILKYRDDSLYRPEKHSIKELIGKFRHFRPQLSADELEKYDREKKMLYSMTLSNETENLIFEKKYSHAISHCLQIIDLNPFAEASASRKLSEIYLKTGKPDSALFYAARVLVIDPSEPENINAMANYLAANGQLDKGVKLFEENLKQDMERDHKTYFYLGLFYVDHKLFAAGIDEFKSLERYFSEKKKPTGLFLFCLGQAYQGLALQTGDKENLESAKSYYLKAKANGYEIPKPILDVFGI